MIRQIPSPLWLLVALAAGCGGASEAPPTTPPAAQPDATAGCPEGTALIAGGAFVIGEDTPEAPWHAPAREVTLDAFCIDVYEYPNRAGEHPRADVTWPEARDACAAAGKRLCSAAEWERACRGPQRWRYSYGPDFDPNRCFTPWPDLDSAPMGSHPVAPSGARGECVSPEGVRDLNGNVSEWVADAWTQVQDRSTGPWRALRGGTAWGGTFYGQDCTSRHGHQEGDRWGDDGFRCCQDPS